MSGLHHRLFALMAELPAQEVFAPERVAALRTDPRVAEAVRDVSFAEPFDAVLAAMRGMAMVRDQHEMDATKAELVATLPGFHSQVARTTQAAVADLVDAARHQVIAIGYQISDKGFVAQLHAAGLRGVQVIAVCNREGGDGSRLLDDWPPQALPVRVYCERPIEIGPWAKMHGKAVLADGERLFVSSANFTWHGMNANIELGVVLSGPTVRSFHDLIDELFLKSELLERLVHGGK
jgi:phosphatidylserine/phosphatidylglycerophosphate/cardiolipin synthase-like enzyme